MNQQYFLLKYNTMKISLLNRITIIIIISSGLILAQDTEDFVSQSEQKFNAGAIAESIELLNQAIEDNPANAKAYRRRGRSQRYSGNVVAAINDYNSSLNLNPNEANTFLGRAQTLLRVQNYEAALQDFQTVLKIDPNSDYKEAILYNTAWIYQYQKDFDQALIFYDQVLASNPNHQKALVNRAFVKYQQNKIQDACVDWILAKDLGNTKAKINTERACQCCL